MVDADVAGPSFALVAFGWCSSVLLLVVMLWFVVLRARGLFRAWLRAANFATMLAATLYHRLLLLLLRLTLCIMRICTPSAHNAIIALMPNTHIGPYYRVVHV